MLEGKKRVQDNSIEASETKVATIHYYWLDIIRFLAAFSVLLCHGRGFFLPAYGDLPAMQQTPLTFCFYFLTRFGHEAVIVFFVLSGFLVGGRGIARMISGKFDITSYAIDRFVRILLPLFGALLFHLVSSIIYGADVNPLEFIGNLFSLQGVFVSSVVEPLWSLSYEVWFYIMLGAIACFVLQRNRVCRYGALFVLLICSYIFYKLQAIYLFIWVLGALGYFLVPSKPNYRLLWLFASFAILSLMLCQIAFTSRAFPWIPEISLFVMLLLFATFCILWMVQQVMVVPRKKVTLVANRCGTYLAVFSYTMYLSHVTTFRLLEYYGFECSKELSLFAFGRFFFCVLVAVLVSYLLYLCFEKHTKWLKNQMKRFTVK